MNTAKYKIERQYIFSNKEQSQICNFLQQFNKSDLNLIRDHKGNTALHQAAYCSDKTSLLKRYLSYMENYLNQTAAEDPQGKFSQFVNSYNHDGLTALHFAAYKGHFKTLQVLCNYGADRTKPTKSGQSVLHMAAQGNVIQTFIFFESSVNINLQDNKKSTPLHWAAYMNSQPIVTYLLSRPKINIDAQDQNDQTALHLATVYGHTKIVKKLLRAGANTKILNKKNETAIKIAEDNEFKNIERILNEQNGLMDYIKLCLNLKTIYRPTNRSALRPIIFITLYLLTIGLRIFLFNLVSPFQFCLYIQIGFYTILSLIYISLIQSPKRKNPQKYIDFLNGGIQMKRVCLVCALSKPSRSFHCQICKTCIERYDHHCYWINNCVGKANLKRFIIFIILFQIFLVYMLAISVLGLLTLFEGLQIYVYPKTYEWIDITIICYIFCFVMGLFCTIFSFPLLCLISVHVKNIFLNKTTYERFTKDKISMLTESTSHLLEEQIKIHKRKKWSFRNVWEMCKDEDQFEQDNINKSLSSVTK